MARRMGGGSGGLMSIGKSKAKVFMEKGRVSLLMTLPVSTRPRKSLRKLSISFTRDWYFQAWGAHSARCLLVGSPGTGKTLL